MTCITNLVRFLPNKVIFYYSRPLAYAQSVYHIVHLTWYIISYGIYLPSLGLLFIYQVPLRKCCIIY